MTYAQVVSYLYSRLPMFSNVGSQAIRPGLANIRALCNRLGDPQDQYPTIHIAGTNGKGSTSHMLSACLMLAGYKVGLYTSPHLVSFTERVKVNGTDIPEESVVSFIEEVEPIIEELNPSFFEITVAMAFWWFHCQKVDVAVIEVGLGGEFDSTNIITPVLSIITNVSIDHTNILGDTITQIATAKAGIIKRGVPVVIGENNAQYDHIFQAIAGGQGSPLHFAAQLVQLKKYSNDSFVWDYNSQRITIQPDLKGLYQQKNLTTVMASLLTLANYTPFKVTAAQATQALSQVTALTKLQGRWQVLALNPVTIADTGHNHAGVQLVVQQLKQLKHNQLHIVWGMVADKDIDSILSLLPKTATYYYCAPAIPRALSVQSLSSQALRHNLQGSTYTSVYNAVKAAQTAASTHDVIFIGGSTFVVAEALPLFHTK